MRKLFWRLKLYKSYLLYIILIALIAWALFMVYKQEDKTLIGVFGTMIGVLISGFMSMLNNRSNKDFDINRENSLYRKNNIYIPMFDELNALYRKSLQQSEFSKIFDFLFIQKTEEIVNRSFDIPNKSLNKKLLKLVEELRELSLMNYRALFRNLADKYMDTILNEIYGIQGKYEVRERDDGVDIDLREGVTEEESYLHDEVIKIFRDEIENDFIFENLYENKYPGNNMDLYIKLIDALTELKPNIEAVQEYKELKSKYQIADFILNKFSFKEKINEKVDISSKLEQHQKIMKLLQECLNEIQTIIVYINKKYDFSDV
ncbi:hypothetical protein [Cohnella yongneupensis]|uniref:5-bromo-4-chloroindolyl phosphate hydrolysis protein n=1 Tax=Cohnella yongneupensis TaxID=425006 RepID=A0ABW0R1V9_9BACL